MSGTWSSTPGRLAGGELHGDQRASPRPSLGRNLSSGNVTVNLIAPNTIFADRQNNIDFRVAKILRYGRTRTQVGVDIYNLTNTDVVTGYNQGVRGRRRVADTDGHSAGALRQDQRAVRLLTRHDRVSKLVFRWFVRRGPLSKRVGPFTRRCSHVPAALVQLASNLESTNRR